MTDQQRETIAPERPDEPDPAPSAPWDHLATGGGGARPADDEFDGGRSGVSPEFPGPPDEAGGPDGPPHAPQDDRLETVTQSPSHDPGSTAVDDRETDQAIGAGHQAAENLDRPIEREHVAAPNQGFRVGG